MIKPYLERVPEGGGIDAHIEAMQDELNDLRAALSKAEQHIKHIGNDALRTENAQLRIELAALKNHEPVAWIEWDIELDEGDPDSIVPGNEKPELCADGWDWKPLILAPGAQG